MQSMAFNITSDPRRTANPSTDGLTLAITIEAQRSVIAANPLELIADWLLARYPIEAAADQIGTQIARTIALTLCRIRAAMASDLSGHR
jgi:hypothetical protein